MTLPNVPTVTIELDKPRRLAMTLGAMLRIKQERVKRHKELSALTNGDGDADHSALMLGPQIWAMLVDEDRAELTIEQVEGAVHMQNMDAIISAIEEISGSSAAEGTEGKAGPATA